MLCQRGMSLCATLQVREREADLDNLIMPIEDMYSLLARHATPGQCAAAHAACSRPQMCRSCRRWQSGTGSVARLQCGTADGCALQVRGARAQRRGGHGQRPALQLEEAAQAGHGDLRRPGEAAGGLQLVQATCPRCWAGLSPADCCLAAGQPSRVPHPMLPRADAGAPAAQVGFKKTLTKEVAAFAQDAKAFRGDWQVNGPMVPGLAPLEAVERLKKFQQMFDVRALAAARLVGQRMRSCPLGWAGLLPPSCTSPLQMLSCSAPGRT